jgi:hypothetical protein
VTLRHTNFREAARVLDELGIPQIGGALLDLGVSSRQLENADRGFSLMRNGPLDMRMDPRRELTADEVVNTYTEEELTRIFRELGEEPAARRIASQIVKLRKETSFRDTLTLAKALEKIVGRHGRRHPATQVFQALRMEVNDELGALQEGLVALTAGSNRQPHRRHYFPFSRGSIVKNFSVIIAARLTDRSSGGGRTNRNLSSSLSAPSRSSGRVEQRITRVRAARGTGRGKDLMSNAAAKFQSIDAPSLARWIVLKTSRL